jgi:hypothetical protein
VADPELGVTGWHLFTFNAIETTVAWWRERLAVAAEDLRLARERDPGSSTDATSPSPPTDPEPGP